MWCVQELWELKQKVCSHVLGLTSTIRCMYVYVRYLQLNRFSCTSMLSLKIRHIIVGCNLAVVALIVVLRV